jgi:hypothetical protein
VLGEPAFTSRLHAGQTQRMALYGPSGFVVGLASYW